MLAQVRWSLYRPRLPEIYHFICCWARNCHTLDHHGFDYGKYHTRYYYDSTVGLYFSCLQLGRAASMWPRREPSSCMGKGRSAWSARMTLPWRWSWSKWWNLWFASVPSSILNAFSFKTDSSVATEDLLQGFHYKSWGCWKRGCETTEGYQAYRTVVVP